APALGVRQCMNSSEIIEKFESRDSHSIWEATWEILRCADKTELKKLMPYLKKFKEIINGLDLGGAIYSNKNSANLALSHIEQSVTNICHCSLFTQSPKFSPSKEAEWGHVSLKGSEIKKELYEEHYDVVCNYCGNQYFVREVHGWHVPWYEWKIA
ncbi:hypothetical protein, partial [Microbulbifer mangrovi]|uniref:hypothetical protein n=1 Tax=Microbulbifer mangrovi TaxID=927787 RepID=UPI0009908472